MVIFTKRNKLVLFGARPLVVVVLSDTSVMFVADMMVFGVFLKSIGRGDHTEGWNQRLWEDFKASQ